MFEILIAAISGLSTTLSSASNGAIASVCAIGWYRVFPYAAGIVIGIGVVNMLMEDDLVSGIRKLITVLIPLLVVAWLIRVDGGTCRVVKVKDNLLAAKAEMVEAVAPGYGGTPEQFVQKVMGNAGALNSAFLEKVMASIKKGSATTASTPPPSAGPLPE